MMTYNVLWLDDDFQPTVDNPDAEQEKINDTREALASDAAKAIKYGLCVDCVSDRTTFLKKIQSFQKYQAVIFDLKGLNPDDSTDDDVMADAYDAVKDWPLSVYVYSGNPKDPNFKITLRKIIAQGNAFSKYDGPKDLFLKIKSDLDSKYNFYEGHNECLSLYNEGFLSMSSKAMMDEVLSKYHEGDKLYAPYNSMRQILEDMLGNLVKIKVIREKTGANKYETFNNRMFNLAVGCYAGKDEKPDYNAPFVPFSTCRREIKYVLSYLQDITNRYSHFLEDNPNYIRNDETIQDYNLLIQQSVYPAFFTAMKWYYGFMSTRK